jgi:biopolymer transport protein ExbD/biopolymer transport protein TolR
MGLPTRFKNGNDLYQPLADINVTPLVDVMLVLLIIFMVTAPLLAKGVKVNLPQAKAAQPLNPKEPVVVAVGKDGKIFLGSDEIKADGIADAVRSVLGEDLSRVVHVRGDKEASYGDVVSVMDRLAANGITHIAILTDPKAGKRGGAAPSSATAPATVAPAGGAPSGRGAAQ